MAVQDGNADQELGDLLLGVTRHESLAQPFDTMHLRFDSASAVAFAKWLPQRTAEVF